MLRQRRSSTTRSLRGQRARAERLLSTGLEGREVLGRAEALVRDEVLYSKRQPHTQLIVLTDTHAEEIIRIPIETRHLRSIRREERVHLVRPVAAVVHVPRLAGNADGICHGRRAALRVVGVRDRAGAVVGHPDHDLVLGVTVGRRRRE